MIISEVVGTKHIIARQISLQKSFTKFYDDLTNNLVADTGLHKTWRTGELMEVIST